MSEKQTKENKTMRHYQAHAKIDGAKLKKLWAELSHFCCLSHGVEHVFSYENSDIQDNVLCPEIENDPFSFRRNKMRSLRTSQDDRKITTNLTVSEVGRNTYFLAGKHVQQSHALEKPRYCVKNTTFRRIRITELINLEEVQRLRLMWPRCSWQRLCKIALAD